MTGRRQLAHAASVPAKKGIRTWPAFCSGVMAATAAAAASLSRCCGPQPRGLVPGSGAADDGGGAGVVRWDADGDALGEGVWEEGAAAGAGTPVQALRAVRVAAAAKMRVVL